MARVLVVEDYAPNRELFVMALERAGFDVAQAGRIKDAIALPIPPDALVIDIGLPDGDGRRLLEHYPGVPALVITGDPEVIRDSRPYLLKPFSSSRLVEEVKKLLPSEPL